MAVLVKIKKDLKEKSRPEKIEIYKWLFKTGEGEYAEGDKFLAVSVPDQRKIVKKYLNQISLEEIDNLLNSKFHEFRLTGLFFLVEEVEKIFKVIKKTENLDRK